jgi:hypothetical protein
VTGPLVAVDVREDTETLATVISRDIDDGWMLLPRNLVERFEEAQMLFRAVEAEVSAYIEAHGLELNYDDEPPEGT